MSSSLALDSAPRISASSWGVSLSCDLTEFENRLAALLQLAQIAQPLVERAQLRIVQRAGRLLAVAGDEGHGRAGVQQFDRRGDLSLLDLQFLGDAADD